MCRTTHILLALLVGTELFAPLDGFAAESRTLRRLTAKAENVRVQMLSQLHPLRTPHALDDLITAVDRLAAEADPEEVIRPSLVAMIYLIGQFQDDSAEAALIDLLDSQHLGISMVAADALGRNKRFAGIPALIRQSERAAYAESYAFRFNTIRALASMEHPAAVKAMTKLSQTLDGQLRFQIERLLDQVTEKHFRGDAEKFTAWKESRSSEGTTETNDSIDQAADKSAPKSGFFEAGFRPESLDRIQFVKPQYYGIDIHAARMMFILDHSGSMKDYDQGMTRLDRAKAELRAVISQLPENAEFSILFYSTTMRCWRQHLVPATTKNKQEAIQFINRLGYGDKTNTYGALKESLYFSSDLEAVYLLTDGKPTIGERIAPAAIVSDILHRNRFRHLNFNTIGIAVGGRTEAFLKTLASESGGEFRRAQ